MRGYEVRNNPFVLSIVIISLVLIIMGIPIKENLAFSDSISEQAEILIICLILICVLAIIIKRLQVPHLYFSFVKGGAYLYYLPAVFMAFIYTNGFNDLLHMSGSTLYSGKAFLTGIATLTRALFEEILFRGVVIGLLLSRYHNSKNGVLRSIVISSVLFGLVHIVNIWTHPERGTDYAIAQVCNAVCLGVLYGAIYMKTRSIIVLGLVHFMNNYAIHASALDGVEHVIEPIKGNTTIAEAVASEILGYIIFALPLLMGLYIVKRINREDIEKLMGSRRVSSARSRPMEAEN
jgi:uncharacterized protein